MQPLSFLDLDNSYLNPCVTLFERVTKTTFSLLDSELIIAGEEMKLIRVMIKASPRIER